MRRGGINTKGVSSIVHITYHLMRLRAPCRMCTRLFLSFTVQGAGKKLNGEKPPNRDKTRLGSTASSPPQNTHSTIGSEPLLWERQESRGEWIAGVGCRSRRREKKTRAGHWQPPQPRGWWHRNSGSSKQQRPSPRPQNRVWWLPLGRPAGVGGARDCPCVPTGTAVRRLPP